MLFSLDKYKTQMTSDEIQKEVDRLYKLILENMELAAKPRLKVTDDQIKWPGSI
jgi:hypothetical protein